MTYHADALGSVRTASEIGGVGPVVRVPGDIGSVLSKCRLISYLDLRESSNAGFDSVRRDAGARSATTTATGVAHGAAWSGIRRAAGRTACGDRRWASGSIELHYGDGLGRGRSYRGGRAGWGCWRGMVIIPLMEMRVLSTRQSSNGTQDRSISCKTRHFGAFDI